MDVTVRPPSEYCRFWLKMWTWITKAKHQNELSLPKIVDYELSLSIQHGSQIKGENHIQYTVSYTIHTICYKFCATTIALVASGVSGCLLQELNINQKRWSLRTTLYWFGLTLLTMGRSGYKSSSNSITEALKVYNGRVKVSWDFPLVYTKKSSVDIEIRVYQLVTFYQPLTSC